MASGIAQTQVIRLGPAQMTADRQTPGNRADTDDAAPKPARVPGIRALLVSVWASVAFAVLSLVWGLAAGSQMIMFDGLYSFAAVVLSLLAVLALRTARKGADERYPWGREVWEPLVVVVKAAALGGLCIYALVVAAAEILAGGHEIDAGLAVVYGAVASVGGVAVSLYLRRQARSGSDLVRAEAAEWIGDSLLSVGVLAGFVVALVLESNGRSDLALYVDPALVVVISAVFLWVPARLLAGGFRELLTMSPGPEIREQVRSAVRDVERRYRFAESFIRTSKVGSRLDVEIDFVVAPDSAAQTVQQFDEVRADLAARLELPPYTTAMTVAFTADRKWAA
jgi:cation diffusion facilitator family transporter